jgi:hexose kinase, 1-phosphofructokinase family
MILLQTQTIKIRSKHILSECICAFACDFRRERIILVNTLTLNPAIDKVLYLDKLEKNITSRIQNATETIGGKGTHVSINLKLLGMDSRVFGISHGETGKRIMDYLNDHGLNVCFVKREQSNSRTNYLLVESTHDCTVVAEKGVQLSNGDISDIISLMRREIGGGDYLVLSGDASNCPPLVYNMILDALKEKKLKVFLDTSGKTLKECIACSPYLIKPNLDELSTLCGRTVTSDAEDVVVAIDSLERYRIEMIAVSLGKKGSIIKSGEGVYRAIPPDVSVFNTVGCGDSFLASLIYGIINKMPLVDSLKLATAVSSATAESSLSVGFEKARALELIDRVEIEKLR